MLGGVAAAVAVPLALGREIVSGESGVISVIGYLGGAAIGSLLPDIDSHSSKISKATRPLSDVIVCVAGHRGFVHSLFALLLVEGVLWFADSSLELRAGIGVGYLSHLFLDMLTVSGVRLFYPVSKRKLKILKFYTGGLGEKFTQMLLVLMIGLVIVAYDIV